MLRKVNEQTTTTTYLDRSSNNRVLAQSNRSDKSIMKRYELLLEVERPLVPIDQPGDELEGDQEVDGSPVPDGSPMLDNIHVRPGLYKSGEASSEVEIKSAKIHLSEVLAIVHMSEVVNVSGPAEVVGNTGLVQGQGGEEVGLDPGAN